MAPTDPPGDHDRGQPLATPIVFAQPDRRFRGPAYNYIRASDGLPTYDELTDRDPWCKVKLFLTGSDITYYVCAVTDYGGTLVITGLMLGPLGGESIGDTNIEELAGLRSKPIPIPIERDLHFKPMRLSAVRAALAAGRNP